VNDVEILREVARQLAEVGIHVEVNALDKQEFYTLISAQQSAFHLLGWACETGDAGDGLDSLLHSRTESPLGSFNNIGLADHELDALIEAANRSPRIGHRAAALQAAIARVATLRPVIPLVVQTESVLLSRRVQWDPPLDLSFLLSDLRRER
jgi:ABC-type oligopeptide transport system substrate-binding subunit